MIWYFIDVYIINRTLHDCLEIFRITAQPCNVLYLKHGGQISVEVAGTWGIGLEIPVTYTFYPACFYHKKPSKIKKVDKMYKKKKIERICRCMDSVSVCIYNELLL